MTGNTIYGMACTFMNKEEPFSSLDRHLASLMTRLAESKDNSLELATLLLSRQQTSGNTCLSFEEVSEAELSAGKNADLWTKALRATGMVGKPGDLKPLILDKKDRLYLRRYWEYEQSLAASIKKLLAAPPPSFDQELLSAGLDRLFPENQQTNWQRVAASKAIARNFCVITGGPGTGKTRTVIGILALLVEQAGGPLRIALAAPSGKAAARLKESIESSKEKLDCAGQVKAWLPNEASTIHRLLGVIPDSPYFRHNAERPLVVDAVIIDEASMVDLATMAKLFAAIPAGARVILLGDQDQLTSVEAGYVLGDICHAPPESKSPAKLTPQLSFAFGQGSSSQPLRDSIVELRKNYRFPEESGIYQLVEAINRGDADAALKLLRDESHADIAWKILPHARTLPKSLRETVVMSYQSYLETSDPREALRRFDEYRVLCAVRNGPYGVVELNRLIEGALFDAGLLREIEHSYHGQPVMVTRNDYNNRLFNGDVGITMADPGAGGEKRTFFASAEGKLRRVLPSRLPIHETAFAMTVHKSQGSEFARVLLLLPERDSPLLTRELLYTGLTRARQGLEIWATESVLRAAIAKQVRRSSGLREALWEET